MQVACCHYALLNGKLHKENNRLEGAHQALSGYLMWFETGYILPVVKNLTRG